MKKNYLLLFFDTLFFSFCFFLVALVIFSYFLSPPVSYLLPLFLSSAVSLLIFKLLSAKRSKKYLAKSLKQKISALEDFLSMSKKTDVIKLFSSAFQNKSVIFERKKDGLFIPKNNLLVFFDFDFEGLSKTKIVKYFNLSLDKENIVVFCNAVNGDVLNFAERFNGRIKILDSTATYQFFCESNSLPNLKATPKQSRLKLSVKGFFTKKRATKFFTLGLTFLILSFFVYVKVYYIVCGTLLMVLAVVSRFFGIAETATNPQKLFD